jgi:microcystin-dependent protein
VRTFKPLAVKDDPQTHGSFLRAFQTALVQAANRSEPYLQLDPRDAAPNRPQDGVIAYADGVNWNPGSGAGPYMYVGSTWVALFSQAYPVGSVFISAVATNPATLLGYGTWAAFGTGKVLVGLDAGDPDFATDGQTGGTKTVASSGSVSSHTHTYTDVPNHTHTMQSDAATGSLSSTGTHVATVTTTAAGRTLATATDNPSGGVATGTTAATAPTFTGSATSVVQPYIVVRMWQRTA